MIQAGFDLLHEFEQGPSGGPALGAYRCPAGVWTIGWGETSGVKQGMTLKSRAEADSRLVNLINRYEGQVRMACEVVTTPHQLAALICFAFNYSGWRTSTVLRCHNKGDFIGASRAFGLVNKARVDGKLVAMAGLTRRRAAETALYLQGAPIIHGPIAQAPAPEPSVGGSAAVSGTATVAGLGAGATALQLVNENIQNVSGIAYSVSPLLDLMRYAPIAFGVIAVGVCAYIAWRAYQRRKHGHL